MKKLIASLCAVLACSFLFTATPVQAKTTTTYKMTLTKNYQRIWSNGTNKIYIKNIYDKSKTLTKQKLYCKNVKSGKTANLKTFKLDQESGESYSIGNVYGTTIYLNVIRDAGDGDLYTYNLKTNKFRCAKEGFTILNASGKYMITSNYIPTDISPFPQYIYKITSKGLEKVKKLGQNTSQSQIVGNKVYYAKYATISEGLHDMTVYRCDLNGKNVTPVLTVSSKYEHGDVMLQTVGKKSLDYVDISYEDNKDPEYYRFDLTTEKTTPITAAEAQ